MTPPLGANKVALLAASAKADGYGYNANGYIGSGVYKNTIDKFSFVTDENATDVADAAYSISSDAGTNSSTHGYLAGGTPGPVDYIQKFTFATDSNASDIGDLTLARYGLAGSTSSTYGYSSGGYSGGFKNVIDKFPFASDANATDVGDCQTAYWISGSQSSTHGYLAGGYNGSAYLNQIEKFSFSSDGNTSDVGDLLSITSHCAGHQSDTHSYASNGSNTTAPYYALNTIQKWTHASDNNSTDVGDMVTYGVSRAGTSSTTHGYAAGGYWQAAPSYRNNIEKFAFASDGDATDVGDLSVSRSNVTGVSYNP
jgi:hypothetical protein